MAAFYAWAVLTTALALLLTWRAHRQRRVLRFLAQAAATLACVWVIAVGLIEIDDTGAGGAFDCDPSCSLYQQAVHAGYVLPPALVVAMITAALLLGLLSKSVTGTARRKR